MDSKTSPEDGGTTAATSMRLLNRNRTVYPSNHTPIGNLGFPSTASIYQPLSFCSRRLELFSPGGAFVGCLAAPGKAFRMYRRSMSVLLWRVWRWMTYSGTLFKAADVTRPARNE